MEMTAADRLFELLQILGLGIGGLTVWVGLSALFIGIWKGAYPDSDYWDEFNDPWGSWEGWWSIICFFWPLAPAMILVTAVCKFFQALALGAVFVGEALHRFGVRLGARRSSKLPQAKLIRRD